MNVQDMVKNWNDWGNEDPMFSILSDPAKANRGWNEQEFFATGEEHIKLRMKSFEDNGIPLQRGKALDFGCGVGRLTNALANYFEEVHGVDISATMIEQAKKLCKRPQKTTFFQNAKSDLSDFESGAYDLVFTEIVLQHIPPKYQIAYIEDFLRLLSERGVACFQTLRAVGWRWAIPNWAPEMYRTWKHKGHAFIPMYPLPPRRIKAAVLRKRCYLISHRTFPPGNRSAERFWCDVYVVGKTKVG